MTKTTQLSIFGNPPPKPAPYGPKLLRLILLGCVSGKNRPPPETIFKKDGTSFQIKGRMKAKDLYNSPLWHKRRAFAEASGKPWGIISARSGVINPENTLPYYDTTLSDVSKCKYAAPMLLQKISVGIAQLLLSATDRGVCGRVPPAVLEIHAGAAYVKRVHAALDKHGLKDRITIETPVAGLQIGELLSWYNTHNHEHVYPRNQE